MSTSSSASTATPTDAIEMAILRAVETGDWGAFASLLSEPLEPAPLDDEGCVSALELGLLARAMGGPELTASCQPPDGAERAGYVLSEKDGVAWPLLAFALANDWTSAEMSRRFGDLWQIDHGVWQAIEDDEPRTLIARKWLRSPGRRLLWDLSAATRLRPAPGILNAGGSQFDMTSIHAAAGISATTPSGLVRRHAEAPGPALEQWCPDDESVDAAFRALHGTSDLRRAGALVWLVRRAASAPVYRTGQLSADLRQTLPQQIESALTHAPSNGTRLDAAALLHTWTLEHPWPIARWLVSCLTASPYFGQDAEVLAARLRALDHSANPALAQFKPLRQAAILSAIVCVASSKEDLGPLPLPFSEWLQQVAADADTTHSWFDELPWPDEWQPTKPPFVARRILNRLGVGWLATLSDESFDVVLRQSGTPDWFADAVFAEGPRLAPIRREALMRRWRERPSDDARAHLMVGVGLVEVLADAEVEAVLSDVPTLADSVARLGLLHAIGKRRETHRTRVIDILLEQAAEGSDWQRLNAVFALVRLLGEVPSAERAQWKARLDGVMRHPVIVQNVPLRREVRRLGLSGG